MWDVVAQPPRLKSTSDLLTDSAIELPPSRYSHGTLAAIGFTHACTTLGSDLTPFRVDTCQSYFAE
jgi:hypothetical protein